MKLVLRLSFAVSVVALALVASALVPFANPGTTPRIVAAGDPIEVELWGSSGQGIISFGTNCNTQMAPGEICVDLLTVKHAAGNGHPFYYNLFVWVDADGIDSAPPGPEGDAHVSCFSVSLQPGAHSGTGIPSGQITDTQSSINQLNLGQEAHWGLGVRVSDDNACQGATAWILGLVIATEDIPPPQIPDIPDASPTTTPAVPTATPQPAGTPTLTPAQVTATAHAIASSPAAVVLPGTGAGFDAAEPSAWLLFLGAVIACLAFLLLLANLLMEVRQRRV